MCDALLKQESSGQHQ